MSIESASSATQNLLDRLRQDLDRFESYERKHYAAFRSARTGRVFAFLNPLKAHIRLFLLLDPGEDAALRPGPSTGHYAKWSSVYYIEKEGQLAKARDLIVRSHECDSGRVKDRLNKQR